MKLFVFFFGLQWILLISAIEDNDTAIENYNVTEFAESEFNFTLGFTEETLENTQGLPLMQYQDVSNLRVYKGPLPKFPGTTTSPWIALHSPVRIYIPIRNTGEISADSEDCIQCPRNLMIYLSPRQRYILTPVPTISICSSFARRSGRVHVAVVSGPRPSERLYAGSHQVELMVWKADGPVHSCKYTILVKGRRQIPIPSKSCSHPGHPSDGVLLCDRDVKKYYPHNSVCQIFCPPNYLIKNTSENSSTIVCKNGHWTPGGQISCVAEFCPDPPLIGEHSYWNCNIEDSTKNFSNGTRCKIECASGYVIPSSQTENNTIICNPPIWNNVESISVCKRAHLPILQFCQNRHFYVKTGQLMKITSFMLPKAADHEGAPLSPECSLQGKSLPKGKHENLCEVEDPELKTRQKCNYQIYIEESTGPNPYPGDCKNRKVLISGMNVIRLKPVRFLAKTEQPGRTKIIRAKCKPKGDLGIGKHFVVCSARDPRTKITSSCSFWINIQKKTCPPIKLIPNAQIICSSREVGSVCHYKCDPGYTFVGNDSAKATKICGSNRRWQPNINPVCKIQAPIVMEGCNNLDIEMASTENFTVPLPRLLTALNETLNISCSPFLIKTAGLHQVLCKANDDIFNTTCQFNVSVSLKDEFKLEKSNNLPQDSPKLIDGCENLEINLSAPVQYIVPTPHYLTNLNETLNVSCLPNVLTSIGDHQVTCKSDTRDFNVSCSFHVSIQIEDESTPSVFPAKDLAFQLKSGCKSIVANVSLPINFTIPQPEYQSSSRDTILGSCSPSILNSIGNHVVNCSVDNEAFNTVCEFNVTVFPQNETTDLIVSEKESCKPLIPPLHGAIDCTSKDETEVCQVTCDPGFGFPEDDFFTVLCDGNPERLWKSEHFDFNGTIPDCLPQLEGSAVEVWISFGAFASHCGEELQEQIKYLTKEMCEDGTNCSNIFINCTLDEESDMMLMVINFTVQADFIDEEHYDDEEIPEAEIRLETVMENARKFLTSENTIEGLELFKDSFRKGFITLVCPEGFVPNMLMSKCVLIPK